MKALLRIYFILILLTLLLLSCIFFTKYQNIAESNVQISSYTSATSYVNGFLITSLVMICIQLVLLLLGLPFTKQPFAVQFMLQMLGVVCLGLYILLRMPYKTISYIWGVFILIPFLLAIASLVYRSVGYRKYMVLNYHQEHAKVLQRRQAA